MVQFKLTGEDWFDNFGNEGFSYTRKTVDFQKPDLTFNDYSQSFKLPATKKNNKLFQFYYDTAVQNGFNPFEKNECELWVNNELFSNGALMLIDVQTKNGTVFQYTVQFFSDTINLKEALQDKGLNDIDWEDLNHGLTAANALSYLTGTSPDGGGLMYYPMASMDNQWVWSLAGGGTIEGIRRIKSADDGIVNTEIRPSLSVDEIVSRIFAIAGFDYEVDFDTEDYWTKLYMWVNNGRTILPVDQIAQAGVGSGTQVKVSPTPTTTIYSNTQINDSGLYSSLTGETVIAVAGSYTIINFWDINIFGATTEYRYTVNGTPSAWFPVVLSTQQSQLIGVLAPGDVITTETQVVGATRFGFINTPTYFNISGTTASAFDVMNVGRHMPNMKCIDFIKGILVTFNGVMYFDAIQDKFIIKHREDWLSAGNTIDISSYVNTKNAVVRPPTFYKTYGFEFAEGMDSVNMAYKERNGRRYGSAFYDTGMYTGGNYTSKVPFTSNIFSEVVEQNNQGGIVVASNVAYFASVNKSYKNVDSGVRLMYMNGAGSGTATGTYKVVDTSGASAGASTAYNLFLNRVVSDDINLAFNPENDFKFSGGNVSENNLYSEFYDAYISSIYNPNVRRLSIEILMPYAKIKTLQVNDTITYDGNPFLIDQMVLDVINNKVKFDLINKI